jgi:hypothetical protein
MHGTVNVNFEGMHATFVINKYEIQNTIHVLR